MLTNIFCTAPRIWAWNRRIYGRAFELFVLLANKCSSRYIYFEEVALEADACTQGQGKTGVDAVRINQARLGSDLAVPRRAFVSAQRLIVALPLLAVARSKDVWAIAVLVGTRERTIGV